MKSRDTDDDVSRGRKEGTQHREPVRDRQDEGAVGEPPVETVDSEESAAEEDGYGYGV